MKAIVCSMTVCALLMTSASAAEAKNFRTILLEFAIGVGAALFANEVIAQETSVHPNVVRTTDGKLRPATGYKWMFPDDPNDYRVVRK